jgi:hypothetical protein
MKYQTIEGSTLINPGDQYWSNVSKRWKLCQASIGCPAHAQLKVRRPIKEEQDDAAKLIRATKRIRARTTLGQLEELLAQRAVWTRKQSVATRKLAQINRLMVELAKPLAEAKFEEQLKT